MRALWLAFMETLHLSALTVRVGAFADLRGDPVLSALLLGKSAPLHCILATKELRFDAFKWVRK